MLPPDANFSMEFTNSSSVERYGSGGLQAGSYAPLGLVPFTYPITLVFSADTASPNLTSYTATSALTLKVSAVPLPGGFVLLAGSLLGFAVARKRRGVTDGKYA